MRTLQPGNYLEIGTLTGDTLASVTCPTIAIDPHFQITQNVIGTKPSCHFFQMKSDDFFKFHNPNLILGRPVDFAFLDGMHRCEFLLRDFLNLEPYCVPNAVVLLHDCVPTEWPITSRVKLAEPSIDPDRSRWWTGDVWKTALALKKYRPDLEMLCLDAQPTGLVLITNLMPTRQKAADYRQMMEFMRSLSKDEITIKELHSRLDLQSTDLIDNEEKITLRFWL
jgi:hypothetical protein